MISTLPGVSGLRAERTRPAGEQADPFVSLLIEVRSELRKQKLWALSDRLRDRLAEPGFLLEDVKDGTTWHWK